MTFADHFSRGATDYARFRPRYPAALFDWLADRSTDRTVAWDCATGNGQAAVGLARYFELVLATDPSLSQLAHAERHARVHYAATTAELSALASSSTALVTVAQALHWFDLDCFYNEVTRCLRPGGILAVWSYGMATIDSEVDRIVGRFYRDTVGPFWPPERAFVEAGYRTLPFPFRELVAPSLAMEARWSLGELAGYIATWSAVGRYRAAREMDPVPELVAELRTIWNDSDRRRVRWPLALRAGTLT